MPDIQISSVYFFVLKEYIQTTKCTHLFDVTALGQLDVLAAHNILEKFPLTLLNSYLEKLLTAQVSPHLFFDIAQHFEIKHYGLTGYISTNAQTFLEAAQYIEKFCPLIIDGENLIQLRLTHAVNSSAMTWPRWSEHSLWINEINLAAIFKLIHQLMGTQTKHLIKAIHIQHSPRIEVEHYQQFYQCEIHFNTKEYGFIFDAKRLDLALPSRDEILLEILLKQAENLLIQQQQKPQKLSALSSKLHLLITKYLEHGENIPEMDILANQFHMSQRTFQRKLKDDGIIYRHLIEQCRMQVCQQLLETSTLSLTDIALQLGYANQSSLGRAYKKHHGHSLKQKTTSMALKSSSA